MPGCLLLPLQLEYAALCDCVGACRDTDRLASAALASSSADMQDLGLAEMMVGLHGEGQGSHAVDHGMMFGTEL